jgi:hypothetical protein
VDIGSGALRDNILPLPYKEPSNVLYQLLSTIVEEGRRFAATADMQVSDMSAQAPVGTTLALLERQLKVMTAVQARLHYSFKQELRLLAGLIRDYTEPEYDYEPEDGPRKAKKADYNYVEIIPVSDPNAATMSQRVVQYQAVMQMAQQAPDIYDMPQLHRRMLDVLGIKHADKLVPLPEDMKPRDPVTENMNMLKMEPVKAFLHQDHKSHIQVHMSMTKDPSIMELVGQSPNAPKMQAALAAHIAEHIGFAYREQIEQQMGAALPKYDSDLPQEAEYALSSLMAQAANQVLQKNQGEAAQQQAQQQQQDPLIQMQQQELQLKQQELQMRQQESQARLQIESQKAQLDAQLKQQDMQLKMQQAQAQAQAAQVQAQAQVGKNALDQARLELDKARLESDMELAGMKMGAQIEESKNKQSAQHEIEGLRIGADIAKNKAAMAQRTQTPKKGDKE